MIIRAVYAEKKPFALEHLDNFFGEIMSLLKYVIPILAGLITMLIYFAVVPLSILAIVFVFININYNKRLPAREFALSAVICWLWLVAVALLN